RGKVRNITDFGAFVELEEGIDGLVHVSDISWGKKIKHPKDVLKKDQEVDAIVTNVDKRNQRLSLSMKDLTPSAWETFSATHKTGDVVRGKVTRFTNFGVFVELGEGLEGLCHISELSDDRVDKPEDVAQLGQEMDFKILRIEAADQKIGLSHRAVGKKDEPVSDNRMFSSEAKGGMASLGELANLRLGSTAATEPAPAEPSKKQKRAEKAEAAAAAPAEESTATAAETETSAGETPTDSSEVQADGAADESPTAQTATTEEATEAAEGTSEAADDAPAESEEPAAEAGEAPTAETGGEVPAAEQPMSDDAPKAEASASDEAKPEAGSV
ncbi:MAG: S1 RNA-binding domain-containing protein, partial [Pyrinomonadaceae bacterium]